MIGNKLYKEILNKLILEFEEKTVETEKILQAPITNRTYLR
ncbi:hypothetical protein BGLY_2199 [Bacillus glycinifermentans]|nr:hypothetical protein BGLY_2199 [Bacillus glycinifermentans]